MFIFRSFNKFLSRTFRSDAPTFYVVSWTSKGDYSTQDRRSFDSFATYEDAKKFAEHLKYCNSILENRYDLNVDIKKI